MWLMVLTAYLTLLQVDLCLTCGGFSALHKSIRSQAVKKKTPSGETVERVCSAVDVACIWYWKEVFCLQRSAATARLLKKHAVPACLVIGVQRLPFKAHAWVEVEGRVVNDKVYTPNLYRVLERC